MSTPRRISPRQWLGSLFLDLPGALRAVAQPGGWVRLGNRMDPMEVAPDGRSVRCLGPYTSDLHVARVFPRLGRKVMRAATKAWPFAFGEQPGPAAQAPDLSFIIPFRGADRLPQLRAVLRSLLGQAGVRVECLVIEPALVSTVTDLPPGVRHLHVVHPEDPDPWRKSWAFNMGVRQARAAIVVCHDADLLAPRDYGREILRLMASGFAAVFPQRFLFNLGREDTEAVVREGRLPESALPERIRQNWRGGTLAIQREAYARIGGFDEQFTGWLGEDFEFYDRCGLLRTSYHGYIPFIHLWHPEQASKSGVERERNMRRYQDIMADSAERRAARLVEKGKWAEVATVTPGAAAGAAHLASHPPADEASCLRGVS